MTLTSWRKAILFLLLLHALCGYAADTSLYSFVPLDSPVSVSVDLPLLWEATAGLRNNPMFGGGLHAIEAEMGGLSFEKDILPWAGQAALALTDARLDKPGSALFIQIREPERMIAQKRLQILLQQAMRSEDAVEWQELEYKGAAIRHAEIARGKSLLKIAMATLDGWLVIAAGDGVMQQVIDARDGSIPSLEKHPLFTRAMDGLPPNAMGNFCFNAQRVMAGQQRDEEEPADVAEPESFLFAGSVDYADDNLQFDTIYCTSSLMLQAMLKGFNDEAGKITGASLTELPEGAFATLLIANPDQWIAAIERLMRSSADNIEDDDAGPLGELDELRAILRGCTGEVGVSMAWHEGEGLGLTVAGQTGADADAKTTAAALGNFLQQMQIPVAKNENLYSTPSLTDEGAVFPMLFCWTASKQWLLGASHPSWLPKPAANPALALPDFAQNANLALFGDFSFMQPMLKSMGMDDTVMTMISATKLFTGQWAFAMKIDEDGGAVKCHLSGGLPVMAMSAAVFFPVFAKAREKARQTASVSNLRQLVLYELMYAQDNDECMPAVETTEDMKRLLNVPDQLLISPRTNEPYTLNPVLSGKPLGEIENPAIMIAIYEKTPGPDGSHCAAFLDGHVIAIPAAQWEAYKAKANIP